jgi:hypothetical protein
METIKKLRSLTSEDKILINQTLESLYEKLTEANKFSLRSHLNLDYYDRKGNSLDFASSFFIGGTDEEDCDISCFFYAEENKKQSKDFYRMILRLKTPEYIKDGKDYFPFAFPKKMMGMTGERRVKLCAWFVENTFQIFDADELEHFLKNESVFEERIRFIDWEDIFDNDPNMEKIGNGCYASKPVEETKTEKPSLSLVEDNA